MTHFPDSQDTAPVKPSLWALSPLLVFFLLYLVISVAVQDFYAVPVTVAFTAAAVWAVLITRGKSMAERVDLFSSGRSQPEYPDDDLDFRAGGRIRPVRQGYGGN